jgi:hypothetical protein
MLSTSFARFRRAAVAMLVPAGLLFAGTASAHMTAFDPGVPPGDVQGGTVTLPGGETAAVLNQN